MLPWRRALFGGVAVMGGGSSAKTEADFIAHITGLATGGIYPWDEGVNASVSQTIRTTIGEPTGSMSGTSWGSEQGFGRDPNTGEAATLSRVVQHALPSADLLTTLLGKQILIRLAPFFNGPAYSLNRHGYSSLAEIYNAQRGKSDLLLYFDPVHGAMKVDPYAQTGPTPYSF